MKRIIAIGFTSFAVLIIMAHAVIPHHHHQGIPVMMSLETCKALHKYSHDQDAPHEHDSNTHSECCFIDDVFIRLENEKLQKQLNHCEDFLQLDFLLAYIHPDIETPKYETLSFREKPSFTSYHMAYIAHSLGLRAPPVC